MLQAGTRRELKEEKHWPRKNLKENEVQIAEEGLRLTVERSGLVMVNGERLVRKLLFSLNNVRSPVELAGLNFNDGTTA